VAAGAVPGHGFTVRLKRAQPAGPRGGKANATLRQLHDRMPVIVEAADWPVWLGEAEGNPLALLRRAADGVLRLPPHSCV